MSRRTVVLLVSLLLAAIAAFAVWSYLTSVEDNVRADLSEVVVFRASAPIEVATAGTDASSSIEQSTALSESIVFDGSTILCTGPANTEGDSVDFAICDDNPSDVNALLDGSVAAGPISAGQLITTDMFVQPAELDLDRLSQDIPVGKVAIAINPGEIGSVGGFIRPGDRVNLIASFELDVATLNALLANPATREFVLANTDLTGLLAGGTPTTVVVEGEDGTETVVVEAAPDPLSDYANALPEVVDFTQTVLQDLEVLAVGQDTRQTTSSSGEEETVTLEQSVILEVTSVDAEIIEFVRQRAALALTLLPAGEPYTEFAANGVTVDDIFDFVERLTEQLEGLGG